MSLENYLNNRNPDHELNVSVIFNTKIDLTPRIINVSQAFGLGISEQKDFVIYKDFRFGFNDGDVCFITGDSGGGKSILLKKIKEYLDTKNLSYVDLDDVHVGPEETIVDSLGETLDEAIYFLSVMGLNDAFIFLRKYKHLSDGQKYRFKLAKALSMKTKYLFVDEFCAKLDRITAKVIAYNIQKTCRKMGVTLFAATTHQDVFTDLQPNVYIEKRFMDDVHLKYYDHDKKKISFYHDVVIEEGTIEDYKKLSKYHYKNTSTNIPYKKIFKATYQGDVVGVVLYSPPFLQTKGRTIEFDRKYSLMTKENVAEINKYFIRLSRIVISPKYRACGLGVRLTKETLPMTKSKYVEMVNIMGHYNPFGERAGMKKIEITEEQDSAAIKLDSWIKENNCPIEQVNNPIFFESWCDKLSDDKKQELVLLTGKVLHHPKIGLSSKDGKRAEVVSQEKRYKEASYSEVREEILTHVPKLYSGLTLYYIWENEEYTEAPTLEEYFK